MFSGTIVRALGIVWVNSLSFGVGIVHRLFIFLLYFYFLIPYSIRNVLKNFENYSQLDQPVREPDQLVH